MKYPSLFHRNRSRGDGKALPVVIAVAAVILALGFGVGFYLSNQSISQVLQENRQLRVAVENLTEESAAAVLRVLDRRIDESGEVVTHLRFSELDTRNPRVVIRETEARVRGNLIYLEGMVVVFETEWVQDGRERALLVWRRLFDDKTAPESGIELNPIGPVPDRYAAWMGSGRDAGRANLELWSELWQLAYEPARLRNHGIRAIHGQATILRLEPGTLYRLQLTAGGQIVAEAHPEF